MVPKFDTASYIAGIVTAFIVYVFIRLIQFIHSLKPAPLSFDEISISTDISPFVFSNQNNNNMKQFKAIDTDVMGKSITTTGTLKANEAGNIPKTVEGSAKVSSTDESVAAPSVGEIDIAAGKYPMVTGLTGKAGSAIVTFSVSPDVDGSGDPDISYSILVEVGTKEATSFADEDVEIGEPQ